MTLIVDTNVIISGVMIPTGIEARFLHLWREGEITLAVSPAILQEYSDVLRREYIRTRIGWGDNEINLFIEDIAKYSLVVEDTSQISVILADPTDVKFLTCAIQAKVQAIVTGDKRHLLPLKSYRDIPILTPRACLEQLIQGSVA